MMLRGVRRAPTAVAVLALLIVSVAGAQAPDATLLVLQPADVPASFTVATSPRQTTSDGDLSVSNNTYRRVAGAEASYSSTLLGGIPMFVTSRAVVFRDATGAHGAFVEVSQTLARRLNSTGSAMAMGQEGRRFNVLILGDYVVWRQGNVLAEIHVDRGPAVREATDYAPLQQNRIAALVPPADPGPATVKPVIGTPHAQPARPSAGKRFNLTFRVTWSDDGSALTSASVATKSSIASRAVPHRYSFGAGRLTISMAVPRTAKGKELKITATVRSENRATTKTVAYRVR
jgi:hypothetical protein